MNGFEHIAEGITLLDTVVKGLIIGILASAPMGPVGVLCVQRTLNKGRAYGVVTGLGAASSDIIYALITGYGLSFIYDFISNDSTLYWIQIIGAMMLFCFGLYTFLSKPVDTHHVSRNKSSLVKNGFTGFIITLSNPLIILLFVAMFTPMNFMLPQMPYYMQCLGYLSIFGGAVLWWLFITYAVGKLRQKFDVKGLWIINKVIGSVVMLISVVGAILMATGQFSLH